MCHAGSVFLRCGPSVGVRQKKGKETERERDRGREGETEGDGGGHGRTKEGRLSFERRGHFVESHIRKAKKKKSGDEQTRQPSGLISLAFAYNAHKWAESQ